MWEVVECVDHLYAGPNLFSTPMQLLKHRISAHAAKCEPVGGSVSRLAACNEVRHRRLAPPGLSAAALEANSDQTGVYIDMEARKRQDFETLIIEVLPRLVNHLWLLRSCQVMLLSESSLTFHDYLLPIHDALRESTVACCPVLTFPVEKNRKTCVKGFPGSFHTYISGWPIWLLFVSRTRLR